MAAYEVLLLNTAVPQIQAAQSGDTYVVPRDIAINANAVISANSATDALRITQTGAGNALLVEDSANPDSTPFVVTAAGDVGIGVASPSTKLDIAGAASTNTESRFVAKLADTSAVAQGNGGGLVFRGVYTGSTLVDASGIQAYKENATDGNYAYGLAFVTRANGGNLTANMRLDGSGNLGLGVTPSVWVEGTGLNVGSGRGGSIFTETVNYGFTTFNANAYYSATNTWKYVVNTSNPASRYQQLNGVHSWYNAPSGTAGNTITFTQAMTLDALGRLGIGETNPASILHLKASSATITIDDSGDGTSKILFRPSAASYAERAAVSVLYGTAEMRFSAGASGGNFFQTFLTNGTERARITSGGYFKASDNGSYTGSTAAYHEFYQSDNNAGLLINTVNASFTAETLGLRAARNTTNNSFYAIGYYNNGAGAYKLLVADSGTVTNATGTYGTISDAKMKTDIVDAGSQWADIKALRFRKFKMINDPDQRVQLGVVAQEVELTSPGLVDEHVDRDAEGNDLGTTTKSVKTSILLMKAAVALQEAMTRIETLEAEVAALKGA